VLLAQRTSVPRVSLALTVDAGSVVDPADETGLHETMIDLLTEGTTTRTALQIAQAQEALGSTLRASAGIDSDTVYLQTLSINLAPSLELLADVVRNPAFRQEDVARVREQRMAEVAEELSSPGGLANRAFMPLVYGDGHPYAKAGSAGDAEVIASLTPARLAAAHSTWFRPDLVTITAVGDVSLDELVSTLEQTLGDWQAPASPAPVCTVQQMAPPPAGRLVVVDRPNSPSSYLVMGRAMPLVGHVEGSEPLLLAGEVLGGGFLSRLNLDLRETKGWTYGISASFPAARGQRLLEIATQVQADRTADSIRAIIAQMDAFPATRPVGQDEFQRATEGNILGLPNELETNAQVLQAMLTNQRLGRDLLYQAQLPEIYAGIAPSAIERAAAEALRPENLTIVVVGDREVIDPQLETLDMPITYLSAEEL
jgi:predicted Zn-dependent peptidase